MMETWRNICKTCRYWRLSTNMAYTMEELKEAAYLSDGDEVRQCHRRAPRPTMCETPDEPEHFASWPLTYDSDHCGDYMPVGP